MSSRVTVTKHTEKIFEREGWAKRTPSKGKQANSDPWLPDSSHKLKLYDKSKISEHIS